jgi:Holliday junction resolvase RusA-like endonuclease
MVRFRLEGRPVPFGRHEGTGKKAHNPEEYAAWRAEQGHKLKALLKLRPPRVDLHDDPVRVHVWLEGAAVEVEVVREVHALRPKGLRGDIDNYVKGVLDVLVDAGVVGDDRQVQAVTAEFVWSDR